MEWSHRFRIHRAFGGGMRQLVYKVGDLIIQIKTGRLGLITKVDELQPWGVEIQWTDNGVKQIMHWTNIVHEGLYRKRT